ncbi:DUF4272 domain-containing protein [Luteolibacter sp. GHJ8]|uniref:DUF4272 domain-containing protein n=1 Tax=Luteolibacter rhizosphaerae TaxID=2989719 RepID=A0ABT3FYN5_9BACT|nr:DUF4272 domain-containing protein [Luteolibacter rhizosphaerae]MCW1912344.1 DUF4272 domain-containing protein [Luteolibacter rhizosphaerae]
MIDQHDAKEPSKESSDRKQSSLAIIKAEGVPSITHLPMIYDSTEAKIRGKDEIAHRAIAVALTAVKGEGIDQETIDSLVTRFGAEKFFSPVEAAFIKDPEPSQHDKIQFSWRYECLWVLFWSLGYIGELDRPEKHCDVARAVTILRDRSTEEFIRDAKLRPIGEILDQADLIYRYHWAVTDARIKNLSTPAGLDGGVVMERHYVLNWLTGYMDQDWDEVSTDT